MLCGKTEYEFAVDCSLEQQLPDADAESQSDLIESARALGTKTTRLRTNCNFLGEVKNLPIVDSGVYQQPFPVIELGRHRYRARFSFDGRLWGQN